MQNKSKAELIAEIEKLRRKIKKLSNETQQDELERQTIDLKEVFENVGFGISLVNKEGMHIESNSMLTKILGYSSAEFKKMHFKDITHPDDIENDIKYFKQVISGKKIAYRLNKRYIKKNGQLISARLTVTAIRDKSKRIKYLIRILEDTTEQIEIGKKLSFEQKLLHALMRYSPDSIYFKDVDSKFIRVNNSKAKKHGYKNENDLIGKSDFDLYLKSHAEEAIKDEKNIIKTGKSIINKEEKIDWKNGNVTWVSTTKMPLYGDDGKIIGTFGITRDISDRVKFEHGLRESEERYRTLFENSEDGILMINFVFEDCNPAAVKLFGADKEVLLGKHPHIFLPKFSPTAKILFNRSMKRWQLPYLVNHRNFTGNSRKTRGNYSTPTLR
jgi:PAS domain S-box-containing protein